MSIIVSQIVFKHDVPLSWAMDFEREYEEDLRSDAAEKMELMGSGLGVWMFVNEQLVGECIGIFVPMLGIRDEDEPRLQEDTVLWARNIYCASTTIKSQWREHGLGLLLKTYWMARMKALYSRSRIIGHATSQAMWFINAELGATPLATHYNWYGTERKAIFYAIRP